MDGELQALREARLAELKRSQGQSPDAGSNGNTHNNNNGNANRNEPIGAAIARFLEPEAFERLTRVSLVRPDRAMAVEQYLKQIIASGQVQHKVNESEIVQILNGIAKEENKKNDTKIIFNRREVDIDTGLAGAKKNNDDDEDDDDEDDFFD
ncbi:Sdd2p NDAI_0H01360 [Naumovozyma dairenensis CBS 421]|uniref:Programmed cell death protein 5 n=1 Tax=Naumovozyma dairenensis (strain ATCC 10597 / BCRC 20456 / CBS 421 / NBRC 0211 / NRRL Y-12639) TaxID=1071378 RepID=G0WEU9_NAUDC|nr:hypothetical protein NDAI_0H01360 [Naumovozyma dairenensis CBS 421]CCD26310.1 hypothetical protein NDAI_0H01360 [Naumovozyma dairenensis CBS 421]